MKLSPTMVELLTDLATNEEMYIDAWRRWDRTARALVVRGLAEIPDCRGLPYSTFALRITPAGRREAAARGIA